MFQYKQDQYSINTRFITDLRKCIVRRGTLDQGKGYFEIRDKHNKDGEVIRITFATEALYKQWGLIFMESVKSD